MAHTLQVLSIISFAVAGVCLVLAIFFWIFFKIPTVIGDLSGRTAKKSIEKMRAANEKSGVKAYKASKLNAERGKLTSTMPGIEKVKKRESSPNNKKPETGLLEGNRAEGFESEETCKLESETTGLLIDDNATTPLAPTTHGPIPRSIGKKLEMMEEVMFIHTDEVIE